MIGNQVAGVFAPPIPPTSIVTGGTLYSDSTYYYRVFTGNGTLTVSQNPLACDILVVAVVS